MNREPYRFTGWTTDAFDGRLFTCARPGRSRGPCVNTIPDDVVHQWADGVPGATGTCIVSLLGRKPGPVGRSEFAFYSFRGGFDSDLDRPGCPTFQEWLDRFHARRQFCLFEFPTTDGGPPPPDIHRAVVEKVTELLTAAKIVVLVDSGGVARTGSICRSLGASPQQR